MYTFSYKKFLHIHTKSISINKFNVFESNIFITCNKYVKIMLIKETIIFKVNIIYKESGLYEEY